MNMTDITITGDLGSGKSSIAKVLCRLLDFEYYSTGTIQRQLGLEKGMNTLELNYHSEKDGAIDKLIDDKLISLNESRFRHVFDSRMAWHFIKKSFKIYTTVNPLTAAKRVMADSLRTGEPVKDSIEEKAHNLIERRIVEDRRFKQKYGVDCGNLHNYNIIVDTSRTPVDELARVLYESYLQWLEGEPVAHNWVSPMILLPTKSIGKTAISATDDKSVVKVIKKDFFFYILNGHKKVSSALANNTSLIPVEIVPDNTIDFSFDMDLIHEWEQQHGFLFDFYPTVKVGS